MTLATYAGLTYMSIADTLKALELSQALIRWTPTRTRRTPKRRLYLAREAMRDLCDPGSAINRSAWNRGHTRGRIEANLDLWVLGGYVYLSKRARFICRLSPPPPEIWEIRVTEPRPQVRLFCRFIEPDTLIVTKMRMRSDFGDKGSRTWETAMNDCVRAWAGLFPMMPPFSAVATDDYITENCDDYGPDCHPPQRSRPRGIRRGKNTK
jgi:hypothetical protein